MNAARYESLLYMFDQVRTAAGSRSPHVVRSMAEALIDTGMNVDYCQSLRRGL